MAHDIVRTADQLLASEATDRDKLIVAVSEIAMFVCRRNQPLLGWEAALPVGDWRIESHMCSLKSSANTPPTSSATRQTGRQQILSRGHRGLFYTGTMDRIYWRPIF
ncbi:hypothetical protein D3C84_949420 [compost metagenome]